MRKIEAGASGPISPSKHAWIAFALASWRDANDLLGLQDLPNGHGNCPLGDLGNVRDATFADLLTPAWLIKMDDDVRFLGLEISGGIIESQMPILADTDECNIDRRPSDRVASEMDHFSGVGAAVQEVRRTYLESYRSAVEEICKSWRDGSSASRCIRPNERARVLLQSMHGVAVNPSRNSN